MKQYYRIRAAMVAQFLQPFDMDKVLSGRLNVYHPIPRNFHNEQHAIRSAYRDAVGLAFRNRHKNRLLIMMIVEKLREYHVQTSQDP